MTPQRALIEAAEMMRNELKGVLGYCEDEMRCVMGNTNVSVLKERLELLESAISSAKAAEEGVETGMTKEEAIAKAKTLWTLKQAFDNALAKPNLLPPAVISVRENEGL